MSYTDKEITCKDCGTAFVWSASEQEFFAEKGLQNTPSRCPICRKKKDIKHSFQKTFDITCKECGKKSRAPIEPEDARDVLCQECFEKQKNPAEAGDTEQAQSAATVSDAS